MVSHLVMLLRMVHGKPFSHVKDGHGKPFSHVVKDGS